MSKKRGEIFSSPLNIRILHSKKGLSDVVATLMIILFVLVVASIIWGVIRNVISSGSEEIELGRFSYDLNIRSAYLDSQNSIDVVRVTVRRNAGGENLSGMRFTFSDGGNSYIADRKTPLEETQERTFTFNSIEIGVNIDSLTKVSVVPIYEVSGRERIGQITNTKEITPTATNTTSPICTPGQQQGTTCLVCNAQGIAYVPNNSKCSAGQTCNSAGQCVADINAPIVSITHVPLEPTSAQTVTFTATASDVSGILEIKIFVDGINVNTCPSVASCSYTGGPYSVGSTHTYYATAIDNSPNANEGRDPTTGMKSFTISNDYYSDVLVIINSNSQISEQVGTYFTNARNIPPKNIIRINAPTTEEISPSEFNNLRLQIENYIINNNLQNSTNYIVTTKGVPLKVKPVNDSCFSPSSGCASVESELTLILGPYNSSIGGNRFVFSPYYYQNAHFSRATYGIYLVTRLDGYTFDNIKAMIDKVAQPIMITNSARFVFDQDPDWNSNLPILNNAMASASTILTNKGYNSLLNTDSVYVTNQTDVIGYVSWGSNDHYVNNYTQYAKPHNTWHPGAIVETYVSTSGRTFAWPPSYGQSLIADLIEEGVSGAKGYVYEPYSFAMAIVSVLFDRYTSDYNLAESFYMSSRSLSWMDVVIGDPKASIKIS